MKYIFEVWEKTRHYPKEFDIQALCGLGFTSKNREIIQAHIDEQLALGITTSQDIPHYFLCWPGLLNFENRLFVVGKDTSGEVEFTIVKGEDKRIYIGLISDHCDRQVSALKVTKSKQVCSRPVCRQLWLWEDVKDHWDQITLKAYQYVGTKKVLYQEGTMGDYIPLPEIIDFAEGSMKRDRNYLVMSGTVATVSGYFENNGFMGEMRDPVLGRSLMVDYQLDIFPDTF